VDEQRVEWVPQPKYWMDRYEITEKGHAYVKNSGAGSPNSRGTAGAPGRLTHVSEILDPALTDVSTTPEDGSNTFQGRLSAILSQWSGEEEGEFTLMVSFDLETYRRLSDRASGDHGAFFMADVEYSVTIVREAPPTT